MKHETASSEMPPCPHGEHDWQCCTEILGPDAPDMAIELDGKRYHRCQTVCMHCGCWKITDVPDYSHWADGYRYQYYLGRYADEVAALRAERDKPRRIEPKDPIYEAYRVIAEGRLNKLPDMEAESVQEIIEDDVLGPDRYLTINSGEWIEFRGNQDMTRGQVELSPHQFAAVCSDDGVQEVTVHTILLGPDGALEDHTSSFQMVFGRRV